MNRIGAILLILLLVGCGTTLYHTPCQRNTEVQRQYAEQDGVAWRIGHGVYGGTRHRWLERWEGGEWIMAKDTNGLGGWRVEEYGGYEVWWYEYKREVQDEK